MITDPSPKYLFAIGFMVLGALVYYWFIYKNKRPQFMSIMRKYTINIKILNNLFRSYHLCRTIII